MYHIILLLILIVYVILIYLLSNLDTGLQSLLISILLFATFILIDLNSDNYYNNIQYKKSIEIKTIKYDSNNNPIDTFYTYKH